jgi:spermidine synthase
LRNRITAGFSVFALILVILLLNPDLYFRQILIPGINVTETWDTPYGNITRGSYKGEESLYYNQRLLAYNDDTPEREEDIHYAMLQSDSPGKVIMISGSIGSHLPEILKYPVSSILYIERDPSLARILPAEGEYPATLQIINMDAFRYIRTSADSADVVILLAPPPSTLLLNRYYTSEFFYEIKNILNPDGIFMCSTGPGDNYYNSESMKLNSSVFKSLSANFKNVKPVSGNKLYFIASDKNISLSFCNLAEKKQIKNIYVSSDYLEDTIIQRKSDEISAHIDTSAKENRSSFPIACLHSQSYQFSKSAGERIPSGILLFIVFVLPVAAIKRRNLLMYFSASALAGFEIIILLTLQILAGNMYQLTGLVIAGLMAGLAAGSGIDIRILNSSSLQKKILALVIFYMLFGLSYNYIMKLEGALLSVIVIILAGFLPALLTGNIFRELTIKKNGLTSAIYSADLAGSAFGFILISGFAVPVIGIQNSVYLLSGLILTGLLFGTIK